MKLFFTYGEKTVYFCGIDKEAVTKAVKTRYQDVIKSEEYLEKVFDISFNMPKTFSLEKMLIPHFYDFEVHLSNGKDIKSIYLIEEFFKSINFTNPRHVKKVLNKFEIIRTFKSSPQIPEDISKLIPNLILKDSKGSVFETILCLFIILLYEFKSDQFIDIEQYNLKLLKYADALYTKHLKLSNYEKESASNEVRSYIAIENIETQTFNDIYSPIETRSVVNSQLYPYGFGKFLFLFSNSFPSHINEIKNTDLQKYNQIFTDNNETTNFCKFLIKYNREIIKELKSSNYIIWNLFNVSSG